MIVVTGATGKLGRLVIEELLRVVPAGEIVAGVRSPEKAQALEERGVLVRTMDYNRPETLRSAMEGADSVLLISSSEIGRRVQQHADVIAAARAAGVGLLAYTSLLKADSQKMGLASEHLATEQRLQASGVPYALLRNGWYLENHTEALGPALEHGAVLGAAGEGRFAAAARADYAAAAARVLTSEGHVGQVYELAGDTAYTLGELAAEVARQAGRPVVYKNLPEAGYAEALRSFGLPAEVAAMVANSDTWAAQGELNSARHDLRELIGRPTRTMAEAVRLALASAAQ